MAEDRILESERETPLGSLRQSLQALAAGSSEQLTLFPEAVHTPDELALDFDRWASAVVENYQRDLSEDQLRSLAAINEQLSAMSDGSPEVWSPAALVDDVQWTEIRRLSADALRAFGWEAEEAAMDAGAGNTPASEASS